MANDYNVVSVQVVSDVLGQFSTIPYQEIQGDALRGSTSASKRLTRSALIPLDDDEVKLEGRVRGNERRLHFFRAAMQDEQDGLAPVRCADRDPLLNSAEQ